MLTWCARAQLRTEPLTVIFDGTLRSRTWQMTHRNERILIRRPVVQGWARLRGGGQFAESALAALSSIWRHELACNARSGNIHT